MLSGLGIAVLVLASTAFVAMTGAIVVNVVIVAAATYCRHRRQRTGGVAAVQPTETGRTSP